MMSDSHTEARAQTTPGFLSAEVRVNPTGPSGPAPGSAIPIKQNSASQCAHRRSASNGHIPASFLQVTFPVSDMFRHPSSPSFSQTSLLLTPHVCQRNHHPTGHSEPIPPTLAPAVQRLSTGAQS